MLDEERKSLIRAARDAAELAYCIYSKFPVGAAVLADGKIYSGCNIENASYPAGCCAERVALFKAVSEGVRRIQAIAVITPKAQGYASPCGICRQVMAEFCDEQTRILLLAPDGQYRECGIKELLPGAFSLFS